MNYILMTVMTVFVSGCAASALLLRFFLMRNYGLSLREVIFPVFADDLSDLRNSDDEFLL